MAKKKKPETKVISLIDWQWKNGQVPYHLQSEEQRKKSNRKEISEEEAIRRILMRGTGERTELQKKLTQQIIDTTKSF